MPQYRHDYENCPGECVYRVDWHDFPDSSGYSMARRSGEWFGCMRIVAQINQVRFIDCPYHRDQPLASQDKFSLFEYTKKEQEHGK